MEKLKKEYRKSEFDLKLAIIQENFANNNVQLDKGIASTVYALRAYGFNTKLSCEGHTRSTTVDTFRRFWPYVQITLNNKVVFDLQPEHERSHFSVVNEDHFQSLKRLEQLIVEFNLTKHPFSEKNSELAIVFTNDVFNPLRFREVIERHWNVNIMVCDIGVHGVLSMPQEFLNDEFRQRYLERTQRQMRYLTEFLRWRAIEKGF